MASILTGLAFMHGHIVDRELVLRLGREDDADRGKGAPRAATSAPSKRRPAATRQVSSHPACAAC